VEGYPTPGCFLAKSAESLEKKRVEFCLRAKKCKIVRKNMKIKGIGDSGWGREGDRAVVGRGSSDSGAFQNGKSWYTPRLFP